MGIESNRECMAILENLKRSLGNRFREVYNKGYADGLRAGTNRTLQGLADRSAEAAEQAVSKEDFNGREEN